MNDDEIHVPSLVAELFHISRSEARRVQAQGGLKLRGSQLTDWDVPVGTLNGELTYGKNRSIYLEDGVPV